MPHREEYERIIDTMSDEKQQLWSVLKESVDREFGELRREWRSKGYFTRDDRNFFVIEPKKSGVIEARAHANATDIPPWTDIWHEDRTHSQPGREVGVQVFRVETYEDVSKVIEAARIAKRVWGTK